eukprot:scaffold138517_cov43-Tisochrysis_lutea.AAC.1
MLSLSLSWRSEQQKALEKASKMDDCMSTSDRKRTNKGGQGWVEEKYKSKTERQKRGAETRKQKRKSFTSTIGFEPTQAEPKRFLVSPLNRSGTSTFGDREMRISSISKPVFWISPMTLSLFPPHDNYSTVQYPLPVRSQT